MASQSPSQIADEIVPAETFVSAIPFVLAGLAAHLIIYGILILENPVLERDDRDILTHLKGWATWRDLITHGHWGEFIAYQPIRDLSLWIDLKTSHWMGLGTFHFSQSLIWAAILAVAYRIALLIAPHRKRLVLWTLLLLSVHPVFVGSVAWLSARKHLLSCLFTFLATWLFLRGKTISSALSYALGIVSHPINVLWPGFVLASQKINRSSLGPKSRIALWTTVPLLALGAIANYFYYSKLYLIHTGMPKILAFHPSEAGIPFLALGRYVFNTLCPLKLGAVYYPGSLANIVGLVLFPPLMIGLLRKPGQPRSWQKTAPWLLLFILGLLPITAFLTNVFVSDTYQLVPTFALAFAWLAWDPAPGRRFGKMAPVLFIGLSLLSYRQAQAWRSDRALWNLTYRQEPSPTSLGVLAGYLLQDGQIEQAYEMSQKLKSWDPANPNYPYLVARIIYQDPKIPNPAKLRLLEHLPQDHPWVGYYKASVLAASHRYAEAFQVLQGVLPEAKRYDAEAPLLAAEGYYFCVLSLTASVSREPCDDFIRRFKDSCGPENWNESLYQSELRELLPGGS